MTVSRSRPFRELISVLWPVPAVVLVGLVTLALPSGSAPRLLSAVVALLFLPGYALTLAVFPGRQRGWDETSTPLASQHRESTRSSLGPVERIAMGVGFGVCLIPLYGYAVALGIGGYDAGTAVALSSAATVLSVLAAGARVALSPTEFAVPAPFSRLADDVLERSAAATRSEELLNVVVIVAVLFSAAFLSVSIALPPEGTDHTTVSLLTEGDDGELVADDYPDEIGETSSSEVVFRLENRESRAIEYQVFVQLQRVGPDGSVSAVTTLDEFEETVAPGERWDRRDTPSSSMTGDRLRLAYLVYAGDAPEEPTIDSAYRHLTLWVDGDESQAETEAVEPRAETEAVEPRAQPTTVAPAADTPARATHRGDPPIVPAIARGAR